MANVQLNGVKEVDPEKYSDEKTQLNPDGDEKIALSDDTDVKIEDRDTWGHKAEFILASIGLAVGLGNVWRFPYLCQKNGGGAFLIPYFIMMIIEGLPLFYIEFAIGQRFKRSAVGCFQKMHPALTGVGVSCIVISMLLCIYYVSVIAWCFYYLFVSFTSKLPWRLENCPRYEEYNSLRDQCDRYSANMSAIVNNASYVNSTTVTNLTGACYKKETFSDCCVHDAQLYYFYRTALNVSPSIEDLGEGINWKLVGCLILSWVVVYACIVKGVKSSGKAVYFTATFPYIVLVILFFAGVTLDGASIGLKALFKPDFSKLADPEIWMDAATQMFFTLSLGFGALVSFASYMPIKNNCVKDAYTVVLINCGTSIFAGIVVFSILGHREYELGSETGSVAKVGGGPGLAFITFCDAFLQMPISPLWSILFFIMLILLGIDSEFGTLEGAIAPFYDMGWVTMGKSKFTALVALCMMIIGLGLVAAPGFYAFQIFDDFSVSLGLLFIAFFQTVGVSWVYGNDRFADDIEYMTGKRPYLFWMICWKYISPVAIFIIFIANCAKLVSEGALYSVYVGCIHQLENFSPLSAGTDESTLKVPYPGWAQFVIFIFVSITMVPIIVYLLKDLIKNPLQWRDGLKKRLTSKVDYHPDPYRVDASRRKSPEEVEIEILKG